MIPEEHGSMDSALLKKPDLGKYILIWKQALCLQATSTSSYSIGRPTPGTSPISLKLRNRGVDPTK